MIGPRAFVVTVVGCAVLTSAKVASAQPAADAVNRVLPHAVIYFEPAWGGPSGHTIQVVLAQGEPHIYVQQGAHQGGYVDEIAIDPINLQPGDEEIISTRLREELTRQ